jgi:hypothetical protein
MAIKKLVIDLKKEIYEHLSVKDEMGLPIEVLETRLNQHNIEYERSEFEDAINHLLKKRSIIITYISFEEKDKISPPALSVGDIKTISLRAVNF